MCVSFSPPCPQIAVFRFLFEVVQELTSFLNIYCLSLKKKPAPKQD